MPPFKPENIHGLLLYDHPSSPCARRVRITLLEKGLAWDTQLIDLSCLEQRSPAYLAINPNGFVPTLAHGHRVIYESNVITEYLDDVFPELPLYPEDAVELAEVKMWQSAEAAMAKDYRTLMYQRVMGPLVRLTRGLDEALAVARRSTDDPADLAWEERVWRLEVLTPEEEAEHEDRLRKWLEVLDAHLRERDYLVAGRFTQAEISVFPRVMMYAFVGLSIEPGRYPNVARWMRQLRQRPSFSNTLSDQDRGLLRLSRTPLLSWLGRTLRKPESNRTWSERLRLAVLRRAGRRVMGGSGSVPGGDRHRREIRRPRDGSVPPADRSRKLPVAAAAPAPETITLYDYVHSPHARRIRMVLLEKGLHWQTVDVDMSRMEHKAPAYLAINPNGEIPAIKIGERVLYDSQVIAEYLDAVYAGDDPPRLYPDDAFDAARVRMLLALEAGTHKELRPLFYLHVVRRELLDRGVTAADVAQVVPAGVHQSFLHWLRDTLLERPRFDTSERLARDIILKKLDRLEAELDGGPYLVGGRFTMADIAWFTRIDLLPALGIAPSASRHPRIGEWMARMRERPSASRSARSTGPLPSARQVS